MSRPDRPGQSDTDKTIEVLIFGKHPEVCVSSDRIASVLHGSESLITVPPPVTTIPPVSDASSVIILIIPFTAFVPQTLLPGHELLHSFDVFQRNAYASQKTPPKSGHKWLDHPLEQVARL